jgi:hypothetical protein
MFRRDLSFSCQPLVHKCGSGFGVPVRPLALAKEMVIEGKTSPVMHLGGPCHIMPPHASPPSGLNSSPCQVCDWKGRPWSNFAKSHSR